MRLIDADAFKAEGRELYRYAKWDLRDVHYSQIDVECNIDNMPTIEAEPKHGRWIDNKVAFHRVCSECQAVIRQDISLVYLLECMEKVGHLNYCPNCGASMRDEVEE